MPRRTVIRSLKRLEEDGWIEAKRRHRRATIYNIRVERLADNWKAKLVSPLSATVAPNAAVEVESLSATVAPKDCFECHGGTQDALLSATVAPQSPVRTDPLLVLDHKEPALRAASPEQLTFGPHDIRPPPTPDLNWRQRFADTIRGVLQQNAQRKKHG